MLRTQLTTSTTCSKRTSRSWPAVGITMLTERPLSAPAEVQDAGVLVAARPSAGKPGPLAVRLHGARARLRRPTAWPRCRRRWSWRGPASGRAPGARGRRRGRARSPSAPGPSPGSPRTRGRSRPTSSTSERRRTLRWQVYICVRIRSGDQSGLKNGLEVAPGLGRPCPRRCRRSRPRGRGRSPRRRGRARRGGAGRRGRAGRRTRHAAIARASLEAATMPPFCSRSTDPDARVLARGLASIVSRTLRLLGARRRPGTAPSRRSSGAGPSAASCAARRPAFRRPA